MSDIACEWAYMRPLVVRLTCGYVLNSMVCFILWASGSCLSYIFNHVRYRLLEYIFYIIPGIK